MNHEAGEALEALGFTALESVTYLALLEDSPATAYQVAKRTGKPVANTYKAIASLAARGAVVLDDGAKRMCRAVRPAELLEGHRRRQERLTRRAEQLLRKVGGDAADGRVYQLEDVGAVYTRARAMLGRARQLAVFDGFPRPLEHLSTELSAAARRKVRVTVQCYGGEKVPGAVTVAFNRAAQLRASEPGDLLTLVVDRRELLMALISHDETRVMQAVYTASTFIASVLHAYMGSEACISSAMANPEFTREFQRLARRTAGQVDPGPGPLILTDPPGGVRGGV